MRERGWAVSTGSSNSSLRLVTSSIHEKEERMVGNLNFIKREKI
jgi:hypothetical protein